MTLKNIKLSVLDLVSVNEGSSNKEAILNSVALAQKTEELGYERFWVAEHHNSSKIVSSATAVLIGKLAENTKTIRVGSGGIMLPNHRPLVIAEQFGTLATMYEDRIDLGIGRAPGTDGITSRALGRDPYSAPNDFPSTIEELLLYLGDDNDTQVHAYPGENTNVPIYLLGSSLYSAELAAKMGLPYAFASHFASGHLEQALNLYRKNFIPSRYLSEPYTIACVNGIAADDEADARKLLTSLHQYFLGVITGDSKKLQVPVESMKEIWTMEQRNAVMDMLRFTLVGNRQKVEQQLQAFVDMTKVDEVMITSHIYDQEKRHRSYEIISDIVQSYK
ncbi:LLM class flavin-dependent oxidoreductase [Kurthia sibirica]|uniref:LLM class flavin-dependent oxidoreductase n=1 Tax=Kurthia sibirica TaxID=202750 RepID=A0A2U3AJD0_9BACL|nr:LLM class flavin-dependent oxidoreductase [Kurthia sibirica]PWI24649.1 LLM class flavin-dependent oxidoreductase [Kurthia sibirica]GEK33481.1 hypothetical protein KSI01_10140 [Kurthia sibirica]